MGPSLRQRTSEQRSSTAESQKRPDRQPLTSLMQPNDEQATRPEKKPSRVPNVRLTLKKPSAAAKAAAKAAAMTTGAPAPRGGGSTRKEAPTAASPPAKARRSAPAAAPTSPPRSEAGASPAPPLIGDGRFVPLAEMPTLLSESSGKTQPIEGSSLTWLLCPSQGRRCSISLQNLVESTAMDSDGEDDEDEDGGAPAPRFEVERCVQLGALARTLRFAGVAPPPECIDHLWERSLNGSIAIGESAAAIAALRGIAETGGESTGVGAPPDARTESLRALTHCLRLLTPRLATADGATLGTHQNDLVHRTGVESLRALPLLRLAAETARASSGGKDPLGRATDQERVTFWYAAAAALGSPHAQSAEAVASLIEAMLPRRHGALGALPPELLSALYLSFDRAATASTTSSTTSSATSSTSASTSASSSASTSTTAEPPALPLRRWLGAIRGRSFEMSLVLALIERLRSDDASAAHVGSPLASPSSGQTPPVGAGQAKKTAGVPRMVLETMHRFKPKMEEANASLIILLLLHAQLLQCTVLSNIYCMYKSERSRNVYIDFLRQLARLAQAHGHACTGDLAWISTSYKALVSGIEVFAHSLEVQKQNGTPVKMGAPGSSAM